MNIALAIALDGAQLRVLEDALTIAEEHHTEVCYGLQDQDRTAEYIESDEERGRIVKLRALVQAQRAMWQQQLAAAQAQRAAEREAA